MGIAIIFRPANFGGLPLNPFNDLLIGAIGAAGQNLEVTVSSGFFQEQTPAGNGVYCASQEPQFRQNLFNSNATFVAIHGYSSGIWYQRFLAFCQNMAALPNGATTFGFRVPGYGWHAKVATILSGTATPLLAIIGSSNMTSNAFGTVGNATKANNKSNRECDVVLWSHFLDGYMAAFVAAQAPQNIILTQYIANENADITIEDRIKEARDS